jgi:signal peptidase I
MDFLFSINVFWYLVALAIFIYLIYDAYLEGGLQEAVKFVIIFGGSFLLIRAFLVQPFLVEGPSMLPTFTSGNYLLVDKFTYQFLHDPKRGDVVVFDIPDPKHSFHTCFLKVGGSCWFETNRYLIKRVMGLPGEKVSLNNGVMTIYNTENPMGFVVDDSEILYNNTDSDERTLGENEYYVMGDNRANSSDSRYWGPLPKDKIVGTPILRLTPPSKIGLWPGAMK